MQESLDNARDELKRVDHLFYVSLKYTRTADMMRHMVERLINSFSFGMDSLLKYEKESKKISQIPDNPTMKCSLLLKQFSGQDENLVHYINLYITLRKVIRADFTKREEYRRHVTMVSIIDEGRVVETNIDSLKENYELAKRFISFVERIVEGKEEI
jgi:hypothetical protein